VLDRDTEATRAVGDKFMGFLEHFKSAGVPVDKAVLEDNLWIYAPPSKGSMVATLQGIISLGFGVGAAETTVSISAQDPIWAGRPRSVASVADPTQAQADLYRDLVEAYLEVGAEFGVWAPTDRYSWLAATGHPDAKDLLLDVNLQPKPAYFAVRDVLKQRAGLA
jgi:endo-1,4-beta-xylanase